MEKSNGLLEKWNTIRNKVSPVFQKTGKVLGVTGLWLFRLRKVFMSIPVIWVALRLASESMQRLPETVGLNLQSSGEFAMMVTREYAVYGPLGVTAFCLLLMFCSRKSLFPWLISIFSLVLPLLIYITNVYPY